MELAGTFVREIITLAGYALLFAAVYKLFHIATDLAEIKELLKRGHALSSHSAAHAVDEFTGEEAYAEQLLKSIRTDGAS